MKVTNMTSSNGNKIANQFIVYDTNGNKYFQSYEAVIAEIDPDNNIRLDEKYWNYSNTTGKYRNIFLGETMTDTKKKIKSGEYKLVNLND